MKFTSDIIGFCEIQLDFGGAPETYGFMGAPQGFDTGNPPLGNDEPSKHLSVSIRGAQGLPSRHTAGSLRVGGPPKSRARAPVKRLPIHHEHQPIQATFLSSLGAYDLATAEHSSRVATIAAAIGRQIKLAPHSIEELALSGLLHDIGKMELSQEILFKPGPLTRQEWEEIKRHPQIGAQMLLQAFPGLEEVSEAILTHHERPDGLGYPSGLAGGEIPILGRIIAIADVYDAATNPRTYRPVPITNEDARNYLRDNRGRQFDGDLVEVFLAMEASEAG